MSSVSAARASPTPTNLGGFVGRTADLSDTVDSGDLLHYCMVQYIERYGASTDGRRFATMRLAGDVKEKFDVPTGRMHDSSGGPWIKPLWHWSACGVMDSFCHYCGTEGSFA